MPVITVNMRSSATLVKGQGVGSCFCEQVQLVSKGLTGNYEIFINSLRQCDIIHYHTVNPGYFVERMIKKNKSICIGYVHFLPDTLEESLNMPRFFKKIFYKYLLDFYNSMDYLVTVNPCIIEKLLAYNVNHPKILCIPNYVSEKSFYVQEQEVIEQTRKKFHLPDNTFIVLGAGQLQTRKGIFDFVRVAQQMPHIQFVWAGGFSFGKMSDGYDEIKQILDHPPKNISFLGIVDREEMVSLYNAADIMFLPSFDELFPMTILEALCCKKPLLLRDIPIYPGILFDCYLKGASVEDFCDQINHLANNPSEMAFWQEKAWECHLYYNGEHILKMWESLYNEAYVKLKQEEALLSHSG